MTIRSRSGQAAVEYILLMVIVVSVIFGMSKVFKNISNGMNHYVGDYIICLMDYGELPSLGVQSADLKKHGGGGDTCDGKFAPFSLTEGRPPINGGAGGGRGTASTNNRQNSGSDTQGKDGDKGSKSGKSGSGGDGANSPSDQASAESSGGSGKSGRSGRGTAKNGRVDNGSDPYGTLDGPGSYSADAKTRILEDEGDEEGGSRKRQRRRRARNIGRDSVEQYRALSGRMFQEVEKNQRSTLKRVPTVTMRKISSEEGATGGPKRRQFVPPTQITQIEESQDKNTGFGFGSMIRFLMIAGMVVAILVFFGGQLLNYSNSDS